ncbi:Cloroperoxidase [Paraphaeosphaeria sporulosa]|uniref:Cloroperoxidase n=1 Tax=Paraphaeosphaeria sporulosa TaxID=1460663 RepID=A0A177CJ13_9PLEO|nr:Cloroperoxidase [Paraphaeosphaeria sporulosa]OAG06777.1 Cloroperoxidase [Paraphaeosphaeria sporulosa]
MRDHIVVLGLISSSFVAASPISPFGRHLSAASTSAPAGHEWRIAGPSDSRSPCPMLNSMSNHGWLPHNGKNIDLATIQSAFQSAMGFSTESFISITEQALTLSTTGNSSTFHLSDLAHHNAIEHDGSLSRNDQFFGDDLHFNPKIWATTAQRYGIRVPFSTPVITVETASKARAARVRDAKLVNPAFNLTDQSGSIGETSIFLTAFWDQSAGGVPKDYARVLFEQERIPYAEGFVKGNHTLADIVTMISAVSAVKV